MTAKNLTEDPALLIAAPFVAGFEGFSASPYQDGGGVWTIGFGSTRLADGSPVTAETPMMTRQEATTLFQADLIPAMATVRRLVKPAVTDNAAAALCSFSYNVGAGNFGRSTLLRELNAGAAPAVWAQQFALWVRDAKGVVEPGLVRRRAAEKALALTLAVPPTPLPAAKALAA